MSTTKTDVLLIAPELDIDAISDELWALILSDVNIEISEKEFAKEAIEMLQRYLVAHMLTKFLDDEGNYKSEKVGQASLTNFEDELNSTKYGTMFSRTARKWRKLGGF